MHIAPPLTPADLLRLLDKHGISYERHEHPAVFTCEAVDALIPHLPGTKTKNLFVRDDKGKRHLLLVTEHHKTIDLRTFGELSGVKKPALASADRLMRYLGVNPGSVSLLGLIHDKERAVELVIDEPIWRAEAWHAHPLINTATLVLPRAEVFAFFALTGHQPQILLLPAREA